MVAPNWKSRLGYQGGWSMTNPKAWRWYNHQSQIDRGIRPPLKQQGFEQEMEQLEEPDALPSSAAVRAVNIKGRGWWDVRGPSKERPIGLRTALLDVMKKLTFREREILHLRFGTGDGHSYTLLEVGRIFQLTQERVRQVELKGCRKIHRHHFHGLVGFLPDLGRSVLAEKKADHEALVEEYKERRELYEQRRKRLC